MSVTVYMAENPGSFFVEYTAPRPAPTTPEEEEAQPPSEEEWQDLAGPGGVSLPTQAAGGAPVVGPVGLGPYQARRVGYAPYPGMPGAEAGMVQRQDAVHSHEDLLTLVRKTVSDLVPGAGDVAGYGAPSSFGSCKESVQITRLDEGYLVVHTMPFRKKELSQAVEVESEGRTKVKVVPDWMIDILKGLNTLGRGAGFGPKRPYGFSSVDQVVDFVKDATRRDVETAA